MNVMPEGELVATLEMPDGSMFRGKVYASNITIQHPVGECTTSWDAERRYIALAMEWSMELLGTGEPFWLSKPEALRKVKAMQTALEWKCDYCASIHSSDATECGSCGAARSFLYG